MPRTADRISPRARPVTAVRMVAVLSLCLGTALAALSGWGEVPLWSVPALVLAVTAAEPAAVHLQLGRQRWTFCLLEGALGVALVAGAGAWTVLGVGLGVLVSQALRSQPRRKREFDVARTVLATAAAQAVAGALGGGIAAAAAGMLVFWLLTHLLMALAVRLTSRRPFGSLVLSGVLRSAGQSAANTSLGLVAAVLWVEAPWGLGALIALVALLCASYDQQTSRSAEALLYAELARGQERETGRSSDRSAQVVLTAAARLLGGADVELVLLSPAGPVRYAGNEAGVPTRQRVSSDVFDEPWVMRALGARCVSVGRHEGRPYLSAILGDPDSPLAVLRAQRGPGSSAFDRNEVRLTRVLVGQAESWLSVADLAARSRAAVQRADAADEAAKALSHLGSATAPALLVLRESADRLARLAGSDGAIDDIVEELQLVERAVASLLGAIALAAEPDLVQHPGAAAPVRATTDWTTTGVLR
ncbi:MAG: hypothetical protein JWN88_2235 [Frankiales bacterium]|nr:hypothetical protein [Frankiales bacterium]